MDSLLNRIREKIYNSVTFPTIHSLINKLEKCNIMELLTYFLLTEMDENLFSFLSGVVANFPVTVLLNIMELKVEDCFLGKIKLTIYFFILIFSTLMSVSIIKFTLEHIKVSHFHDNESNKEICRNKVADYFLNNLSSLVSLILRFIIYSFLFIFLMIIMFFINNIS